MDSDSESSDEDFEDAVDILHVDQEQNGTFTTQNTADKQALSDEDDSDESHYQLFDDETSSPTVEAVGPDHSDDQRPSDTHWSGAGQGFSDVAAGQGHHLCEQPVLSTSNPVRPIGGSVSTNTVCASKHASVDQVSELLEALVSRGGETSFNTIETRGDSPSDFKEVHVHLTQTNIHNPAAIALGGPVVVKPPKKEIKTSETPLPPTAIQKLRSETEKTFEKWTEGMIETGSTRSVLDKISQGRIWITITGSPGEGKTTAGYLVLKHLHSMGRNVYDIKSPDDYLKVKGIKQPVIMFNDIFGSFHFGPVKMKSWESVLNDILLVNEHRNEEMLEKRPRLTVMLISRSTVLNAASHHLGRFRDLVLNKASVVDFTHGQDIAAEERMKIWTYYSEKYNIRIDEKIVREVCEMYLPHGFPHCCRLFADMYPKHNKLNMKFFFSKPVELLNQTMESLMMDAVTGSLLREMLKNDGSLQLNSITDDEKRFQYTSVVETLTGTYLRQDRTSVTFHHPSVYDSAAFVVCTKDSMFVIKHCTLSFLNERVKFNSLHHGVEPENQYKVTIDIENLCRFLCRLKTEIESDNISLALSHQSFHDEGFVSKFMQCILSSSDVQPLSGSIQDLIHRKGRESKETFLFLMTRSKSNKILKYVCQFVGLSLEEQRETLFGICEHSAVSSMEYFLCKFRNCNLNVKNSYSQTLLLLASTKRSETIMKLLLERDVDVNAVDKKGCSVLNNICKHGVDGDGDVVKMLVKKGVYVNMEFSYYPNLPLHSACCEGHRNVVLALLQCGADIDQEDWCGNTTLIHACRMNHLDVVTVVVDSGADITKTDSVGDAPLHIAGCYGHVDVVTVLVNRGADVNMTNSAAETPLHKACYRRHVDVVTVLLDRGAVNNQANRYGNTPLHYASESGHVNVVTVLLDKGADINKTNSSGNTPLHYASDCGHVNVVTYLLDGGADINMSNCAGNTPLHYASDSGHVNVVTVLKNREANVNKTNFDGDTLLHYACHYGPVNVVTALLYRGADINKTNSDGDTPLHKACYRGRSNVTTVLLERGADINKTNRIGDTPLHKACYRGLVNVVTVLLEREADVNKANSLGDTPLHKACYYGHISVVTILLDRGADINKTNNDDDSPLHKSSYRGRANGVTVLLDRGADINNTNCDGNTPLHKACSEGHVNVVTVLLDRGADINKTNIDGDTPLHEACYRRCVSALLVLLKRGADINKTNLEGVTPLATAQNNQFWRNAEIKQHFRAARQ